MFAKDVRLTSPMKMIFWLAMFAPLNDYYHATIFNHFNIGLFIFAVEAKHGEQVQQHAIEYQKCRLINWTCFSVNSESEICPDLDLLDIIATAQFYLEIILYAGGKKILHQFSTKSYSIYCIHLGYSALDYTVKTEEAHQFIC